MSARRRRAARAVRNASLALLAVAGLASVVVTPSDAQVAPGSAGTDTSLPLTDSAVTVRGRGEFASLEITVNQTRNLVNQAISITWTGATPTMRGAANFAGHYLQLMQCWGDDDGSVPGNPGPPPEQCVQGATDAVYGGRSAGQFPGGGFALERIISRRDFPGYKEGVGVLDPRTGFVWRPFRAVDGTVVDVHYDPAFNPAVVGGAYWLNSYFNAVTTNEIAGGLTRANGTGAELMEVTTGLESSGLGCGQRVQPTAAGSPKVPRCWLVIVPRGDPEVENQGTPFPGTDGVITSPLSPAAWQHRIAVPLDFNSVDAACVLADDQRRLGGSEYALAAVASWQPALCATPGRPPYAFGLLTDSSARQQLLRGTAGAAEMAVVSRPIEPEAVDPANPVVYAPLTASATVIGFNIERNPRLGVAAAQEALRGVRVAELNLTPRLVAKLLTQSYRSQTALKAPSPYEWAAENPPHLGLDPDFLQFNPEFSLLQVAGGKNFGGLVLPAQGSDATRHLWEWVLADPEARTWLDGEPDRWGMRVNPVYATAAAANPSGVAFADPAPDTFPKSDPHCYQAPPQGGRVTPPLLCGTDWLPYAQGLREAARATRAADDRARTSEDPFAVTADRFYRPDGPQVLGSRTILSVTDTASAHQYGLQMARLSRAGDNGPDRAFIAPDRAGLAAGLASMRPSAEPTVLVPEPTAKATGAYPLTTLTYGAVSPLRLDAPAREDLAAFVDYAAGPGQRPGLEPGRLPMGYVPLPEPLRAQALTAARLIRELQPPPPAVAPPEPAPPVVPVLGGPSPSGGPALSPGRAALSDPAPAPAPPALGEEPAARPDGPSLLTPVVALARSRFVLPALAVTALLSALGSLEITKRPRRLAAVPLGAPKGEGP